ncbi:MAG: zinc ribbon domain-containing protein [Rubrivivax sp.]
MSYVWGTQGIGFEYPTCYRIENRFLTVRAGLLLLGALILLWVALSEPDVSTTAASLITRAERGSPTPHVVAALLMMALAVLDLVVAARQRRVLLVPGQPASLTHELSRQASGSAPGAEAMQRLATHGTWPHREPEGPYAAALRRVSERVALAPLGLLDYLRVRLAHLLFTGAMLGLLALTWAPLAGRAGLPLAALLYAGLAAALAARSAWISRSAPGPWALVIAVAVVALTGVLLALLGERVPQVGKLKQLELPMATALVLVLMGLIEALALLAARAQLAGPPLASLAKAEAGIELSTEAPRLMQEVERELHRFWAEGVPNRRHVWEPPAADGRAAVLEESQPQPLPERAEREGGEQRSRPWLLVLDALGLLLTMGGIGLWVVVAARHMDNVNAPWAPAALATVLVVAGGYALRVGHLLWSRVEVESQLVAVSFEPSDPRPSAHPERPFTLRARVARLRTVFYLAADHMLGSRTVLRVTGDEISAKRFTEQVGAFAARAVVEPGLAMRAPANPHASTRTPGVTTPTPPASPAPARGVARFCHACGTPLLQGSRFCQNCGQAVSSA